MSTINCEFAALPGFAWQATLHFEWWLQDLTNTHCPGDMAHPFQLQSAPGTKPAPKKVHSDLLTDVFFSQSWVICSSPRHPLIGFQIFGWWLIIWPASEVLMRSYFSWMTSPQITSGNTRLQLWTCVSSRSKRKENAILMLSDSKPVIDWKAWC